MRDYAKAERRADDIREALYGDLGAAAKAERAERYAGVIRIERGPAAFRVTFPQLSAHERGSAEAKAAWENARQPMADVKAIPGRTFDKLTAAWIVPASESAHLDILAEEYGAKIEELAVAAGYPAEAAARIAELERELSRVEAERDAAVRLADEYATELEGKVAA